MKISNTVFASLLALSGFGLMSPAQAGSERLVMVMSAQKMAQYQLVHVRFKDKQGHFLLSDVMKRMEVHRGDCDASEPLFMPEDYKFGFSPKKEMGIYLPPQVWKGAAVCFSDPELGNLKTEISEKDTGQSIVRVFK